MAEGWGQDSFQGSTVSGVVQKAMVRVVRDAGMVGVNQVGRLAAGSGSLDQTRVKQTKMTISVAILGCVNDRAVMSSAVQGSCWVGTARALLEGSLVCGSRCHCFFFRSTFPRIHPKG